MNKNIWMISVLVLIVFATACQQTGRVVQDVPVKVITVMPFLPYPNWNPVYVAKEKGFYAEEGLDVTIEHAPEGSFGVFKQVIASENVFGLAHGTSIIAARNKGIPVKAIFQEGQDNTMGIMTLKPITDFKQFEGQTIGTSGPGSPAEITPKGMLFHAGVDISKVTFLPVGGMTVPYLLQGKLQGIGIQPAAVDLVKAKGSDAYIAQGKDNGANYVSTIVVASEDMITGHPEIVKKYLRATYKGYQYAIAHPEEATQIFVTKIVPEDADQYDFYLKMWKDTVRDLIQPEKFQLGSFNMPQWESTQDDMLNMGLIDSKIDVRDAIDTSFLAQLK